LLKAARFLPQELRLQSLRPQGTAAVKRAPVMSASAALQRRPAPAVRAGNQRAVLCDKFISIVCRCAFLMKHCAERSAEPASFTFQ
jgi:hypothetical protein